MASWHADPASDGPREDALVAPTSGAAGGGSYSSTGPYYTGPPEPARSAPVGLPAGPEGAAYTARTVGRRAAVQQLDEQCLWHLLPVEIRNPHVREVCIASRELSLKLQQAQVKDDQQQVKREQDT